MKPVHAVVAGVFALFWVGVLVVVLTLGKDDGSAVDVYAELPPGFTAGLQSQGVTYAGLSPVDDSIRDQVLSRAPSDVALPSGVDPIVLRTVVSDSAQGESLQGRAALMVVVAEPGPGPGPRRLRGPDDVPSPDVGHLLRRHALGVTLVTCAAWPS